MTLKRIFAAAVLICLPLAAFAATIGAIANPIIEQAQPLIVDAVTNGFVAAFFAVATWISGKIGIRFIERLNRQTIQEAARRFASTVVDQIQERYFGATSAPDLSDLIGAGVDYIKAGNSGTVKGGKFTDSKLADYVTEAIQDKGQDVLTQALRKAGAII